MDKKKSKCLFIDDMIVYIENTKELTKKVLGLISSYSKITGYKFNVLKLTLSL